MPVSNITKKTNKRIFMQMGLGVLMSVGNITEYWSTDFHEIFIRMKWYKYNEYLVKSWGFQDHYLDIF